MAECSFTVTVVNEPSVQSAFHCRFLSPNWHLTSSSASFVIETLYENFLHRTWQVERTLYCLQARLKLTGGRSGSLPPRRGFQWKYLSRTAASRQASDYEGDTCWYHTREAHDFPSSHSQHVFAAFENNNRRFLSLCDPAVFLGEEPPEQIQVSGYHIQSANRTRSRQPPCSCGSSSR